MSKKSREVKKAMESAKFGFRDAYRGPKKVAADAAHNEFLRIEQAHGSLTARIVVDESRPETAPLHGEFEWRDDVAADSYRVWQARSLIKAVIPVAQPAQAAGDVDVCVTQAPEWVHVPAASRNAEGVYVRVSEVVKSDDLFSRALSELLQKVSAAKRALESLQQAASGLPESQAERLATIAIAMKALETADNAVKALH